MTISWMGRMAAAALVAGAVPAPVFAQSTASYADRLARLGDMQRGAVLRGAVVNSGQRCGRVETAEPRGRLRNLTMWAVRCTPGDDFGVFVGPDGSAQVRTCSDLAKLRLPTCRLAPRPPKPATRKR
jgi:hypothetical protein